MEWLKQLIRDIFCNGFQDEPVTLGLADAANDRRSRERAPTWPPPMQPHVPQPHPRNAPGPFYSDDDGCIICGAPNAAAPDLMGWHEETRGGITYSHCMFLRQPATPDEVDRAIRAMDVSCVENLRYRGTDPDIRARLHDMGLGHLCDTHESD